MLLHNRPALATVETLETRRLLATGDVDTSFGTNGVARQNFEQGSLFINDMVVVGGNKFVIAGSVPMPAHHVQRFQNYLLQRFNSEGSLDPTFGTNGTVTGNLILQSDVLRIAELPDGKLAAVVWDTKLTGHLEYHLLARFNADGSLDTTFGTNGFVQVTTDQRDSEGNYALAVQSDGKMLVGWENAVRRYNTDGTLDTGFGTNGEVDHIFPKLQLSESLFVLSSGKILVGGASVRELANTGDPTALLAELNADGSINTSFGTNGTVTLNYAPNQPQVYEDVRAITEEPDGKILLAGNAAGYAAARLDVTGQLDPIFGTSGMTVLAGDGFVGRVLLDDQNRIYMVGNVGDATRLSADGAPDQTFGRVTSDLSSDLGISSRYGAAGLLSDGRFVLAGQAFNAVTRSSIIVTARLTEDDGKPSPVTLSNHVVAAAGTPADDVINAREASGVVIASLNGFGREFDTSDVNSVSVSGGDGDDRISGDGLLTIPLNASGGNGRDHITGGDGEDTLNGDGGRDFIDGGAGFDRILGGGGNDQLRGQANSDSIRGGAGNDYIEGDGGNDQLTGGPGNDTLHGNAGNDVFFTVDGQIDSLFGDGGFDLANADPNDVRLSIEMSF
jgi:uncharacterized delta-60 repeat protein